MRRIILIATLAFIVWQTQAQDSNTAWWPAVKVEKQFTKKFSLMLEHEIRYFTSLNEVDRFGTSIEGDYSFFKKWNVGLAYSWLYSHDIDEDVYVNRNRYYLYLRFKQKAGNWSFYIREKFQSTYRDEDNESTKYNPKNALRSKVEVAYKIKSISLTPYINGQLRYRLNHPTNNELDQYRWSVGAEYKFSKRISADLYFQKEGDLNKKKPDETSIIGTTLKIKI